MTQRAAMALDVEIQVAVDHGYVPDAMRVERWANAAWQQDDVPAEIVVRVVDDVESRALNARFRDKDRPTNVLSFPYEQLPGMTVHHAGDLVICAPVVEREAADQQKAIDAHWAHMVVHGVLHLQGFDHSDDNDATRMENRETEILTGLGFAAPYATGEL